MRIVFATGNAHKLREIREILEGLSAEVCSMEELGLTAEAEETGSTFAENAAIKAKEIYGKLKAAGKTEDVIVMADDSGLCIDALDGAPGVLSARFMGHDTPYELKNRALLEKLKDVPEGARGARFVCSICAVLPDGSALKAEGEMRGRVAREIAGANGFGYDPIFFLPEYGKTAAELTEAEKNAISHRGKALRLMRETLRSYGL